jgi:hypothetical protein
MPFVGAAGYDTGVFDDDDFERQFDQSWRPRRRWPTLLRTALALVVLVVLGVIVVPRYAGLVKPGPQPAVRQPPPGSIDVYGGVRGGGLPPGTGLQGPARQPAPDLAEATGAVAQLLRQRSEALLHKDQAAFLAGVDPRARAYRDQQQRLFRRLLKMPLASFEYHAFQADEALRDTRAKFAPDPVYVPLVEARYRFRDAETTPVLNASRFVFVRSPDGWRIGGEERARPGDHHHEELWDSGTVEVLHGSRTLVAFHASSKGLAGRLLDAAEHGFDDVDAAWGGDWDHQVTIMVPSSESEAERIAGVKDISAAAAVAATSIEPGTVDTILAARIVVNPAVARYDDLNLDVVVTHEMTHVATRSVGTAVPMFLVEGFADFAALRSVDLPLRSTRPTLARAVAAGTFDGKLPTEKVFDLKTADDRSRALAYDKGSTFCLWVERTWGLEAVRALYRSFAGADGPATQELVNAKIDEVLGVSFTTAQSRWAAFVRSNLR